MTLADVRTTIGAGTGTAAALTGKGIGVALIDTGVAPVAGLPASKIVNGPDLSFESQAPALRYLDTFGHGTHMAGIIVGNDTKTGTTGIAPGAKLTSIKVGTANGAVDVSQVIAAVDWAVAHRNDDPANPIRIINLSYGSDGTPVTWPDPLQYSVEQAWKAGIVVVAAAGNSGTTPYSDPANDPQIISVGAAVTNGTARTVDDSIASFSNYPKVLRALELVAPGESIESLRVPGSNIDQSFPTARVGTTLFRGTGTSQATAVTSAAVALLLQARPSLTPDAVKGLLTTTATRLYGGGLEINVDRALTAKPVTLPRIPSLGEIRLNSLQDARGDSLVYSDNVPLTGSNTVWGPFNSASWATNVRTATTWNKGKWMGYQVAGDGWTGSSWASKTWGAATWSGKTWSGGTTWTDPSWSGRFWAGESWSDGTWAARFWAAEDWSTGGWS